MWVGPTWVRGVGKATTGEENISFVVETLPKLRFLWSFHLFVITQTDGRVRREGKVGPN
jgi:hypothetical protein